MRTSSRDSAIPTSVQVAAARGWVRERTGPMSAIVPRASAIGLKASIAAGRRAPEGRPAIDKPSAGTARRRDVALRAGRVAAAMA
jgi:hypothetical protein